MLVTFSGLDGAGKSTVIGDVAALLRGEGQRCAVLHMNDDVGTYAYLRRLRDALLRTDLAGALHRTPREEDAPHAAAGRARSAARRVRDALVWSRTLRRLIYPLDVLIFLAYRLYHEGMRGRVLIMDRYFYDTLVDVSDGRPSTWVRLLERITPAPDVAVFLDITPEESFTRKGEYTVEYLRRRGRAYAELFSWLPSPLHLRRPGRTEARDAVWSALQRVRPLMWNGRNAWESS